MTRTLPFADRPISTIAEHPGGCCTAARRWLLAMATGQGTSVAWVGEQIPWGPSTWPVHWCELLDSPQGDCGVQAAVADHCLRANGHAVRRVQMVLRYSPDELAQWAGMWGRSDSRTHWIDGGLCYHEAVAVGEAEVRILDATDPITWTAGADGLVALRIDGPDGASVRWEDHQVPLGQWLRLDPEP